MRVVFRVDSSSSIGLGHLVRCLTLAEELRSRGALPEFVCRDLAGHQARLIAASGFQVHLLQASGPVDPAGDAEETARSIGNDKVEWVIVDHYELDFEWERHFRRLGTKVMVIDDLADRNHECHVLLDQNYSPRESHRYRQLVPSGCVTLLGPEYALVGPSFTEKRGVGPFNRNRKNMVIAFGGADPTGETLKAIAALGMLDAIGVQVVVGASNPRWLEIKGKCERMTQLTFHRQSDDLPGLLAGADLAVGAVGTSLWERCCLGVPSIVVATAENQLRCAQLLGQDGYIIYLGTSSKVDAPAIKRAVADAYAAPNVLRELSARSAQLIDGRGRIRVAERLIGGVAS